MKLSLIIPAYNEKGTILEIIESVEHHLSNFDKEIIVVDDCSQDGTSELLTPLEGENLKIIRHERNLGKGGALRSGFQAATGDIVVIQDADLEYDPAEIPELVEPIIKGRADVVYGSRLSGGRPQRVYLFWHMVGNKFLAFVTNFLYNTTLSDMETGYKVFRKSCLDQLTIKSNGFEVEPEITAKVFKRKFRVYELPISYYGRTKDEGKKISWRHGFGALWTLIKYRFID